MDKIDEQKNMISQYIRCNNIILDAVFQRYIVSEPEHCRRRGSRAYKLHEVKSVSALGLTWAYIGSVAMAIGLLTP